MERVFSLIVLLMLTACIEVRDLGTYWDKGFVDPAVAGYWRRERADGVPEKAPVAANIVIKGGEYLIPNERKEDPPIPVRTLRVGNYTFFITEPRDKGGVIYRYTLKQDILQLYDPKAENLCGWLKQHYPLQKNIDCLGRVEIETLDQSALTILSRIPDEERFWTPADGGRQRYRRLP